MKVILIGAFSEIIELCEDCGYEVIGYIYKAIIADKYSLYGYPVLGTDEEFQFSEYAHLNYFITPDSPAIRENIHNRLNHYSLNYISLISPHSIVSRTAQLGRGVCLQLWSHVSSSSKIGDFVKVNVKANIMHDCAIGDFCTIAPNAAIMGGVTIGKRCYIGANATIRHGVSICADVTIGAGAVVTKNIITPGTYAGVPANILNRA